MVFDHWDGSVENNIEPYDMIKLIVSISAKESADCDYNCKPDGSCRVTYRYRTSWQNQQKRLYRGENVLNSIVG